VCALQRWTTPENSFRPPGMHSVPRSPEIYLLYWNLISSPRLFSEIYLLHTLEFAPLKSSIKWFCKTGQLDIKKHHMLPSTSFARGVCFTKMDNPWKFCLRHPGMHSVPCGGELRCRYHLPEPEFFFCCPGLRQMIFCRLYLSLSLSLYPFADGVEFILNLISEAIHDVWILSLLG
jgi:hypothetical protein